MKYKVPREQLQVWLSFLTTPQHELYPHPRGLDCGPCVSERCGRVPCYSSETPAGIGFVNWRPTPDTRFIRDIRNDLELQEDEVLAVECASVGVVPFDRRNKHDFV